MCDDPVPCECTRDRRVTRRREHMARSDALRSVASRLHLAGQITDEEATLMYREANEAWDDAIHIASADDPLRSLCGYFGRNLMDLPARPDGGSGCWSCLTKADELAEAEAKELVPA